MSSPQNEFIRSAAEMENALASALRTVSKTGNTKEIAEFIKLITKKEVMLDFLLEKLIAEPPYEEEKHVCDSNAGIAPIILQKEPAVISPPPILTTANPSEDINECQCPLILDLKDARGVDVLVTPPEHDKPDCYCGHIKIKAKKYSDECTLCVPDDHYFEISFEEEFGGHTILLKQESTQSFLYNEYSDMAVIEATASSSGNVMNEQHYKVVMIIENIKSNRFLNVTINGTGEEDGTLISATFDAEEKTSKQFLDFK